VLAAACRYDAEGVRRTVDAILLVAQHSHPHVLLLQVRQVAHGQLQLHIIQCQQMCACTVNMAQQRLWGAVAEARVLLMAAAAAAKPMLFNMPAIAIAVVCCSLISR
jgi:hypothetical protein